MDSPHRETATLTERRTRAIAAIAANSSTEPPAVPDVPALTDDSPVLGLIDLDEVAAAFAQLTAAFEPAATTVPAATSGTTVLHAVACKAVPLLPLLRFFAEAGAGCEVASPGELELALSAGFPPETIVFDSPAKTMSELRRALALGISVNADSWEELARLDELVDDRTTSVIGVRINPQSGVGAIGAMSTATQTSKFGIGIADPGARDALVEAYLARPWLTQVHVHSGSQGITLDQAAAGIAAAVDIARDVNTRAGARQVTRIDIGGGLPVNFTSDEVTPTFAAYREVLDTVVPGLAEFDLVTEFGRSLLAKAGTILTRVETAKTTGGRRIAMTHAGVQVATRTAYAPADWPLRVLPFDADGAPKRAEAVPTDVAGPACFAGDLLAENRDLPRLDVGDLVAVPDTGAYYFSNPFSYNLLPRVPVYGYRMVAAGGVSGSAESENRLGAGVEFALIRRGQTIAEILAEAGEPAISPL
ncbi:MULTISPECIES: diaminopimelate decarboxylase [unclassified Brevibacterium]|uniref:diaminopimelate decarboxylase n=1 Tax=unclassified Brevibacterium TaxID=2614124 RepID=UPI0010F9D274|nr:MULTISPECIES: diaminopimelate decarboxylase [unclassified Brevibacterium]MCM1011400.1 diaminopimelate decarboxylase [Brevibacterium sp. XM4083]